MADDTVVVTRMSGNVAREAKEPSVMDEKASHASVSDPEYAQNPALRSSVDGEDFYEDPKAARRLLIKCDIRLIPILGCLYLVSFLDRSNIANARLFGLEKSLSMPSNGFNTCLWIFYLPFVIVEVPSNLFMSLNKIKPNQWLAGAMLILGEFGYIPRLINLPDKYRHRINVPRPHEELRWSSCLQIYHGHP